MGQNGLKLELRGHLQPKTLFLPYTKYLWNTKNLDCEILFWQNLRKAVCFGQNVFFLGIAGKNSRSQNILTYRDSVMVILRFLGQNGLKLELRAFAVHKILMEH